MPFYEYKVVPAPAKTPKLRGLKGPARFAHGLQDLMNELAQDGWEYLRAESLPDEERKGLTGRVEVTRNVLVFRRELYFEDESAGDTAPEVQEVPAQAADTSDDGAAVPDGPEEEREQTDGASEPFEEDARIPRFSRRPLVAERRDGGSES